MIKRVPAATINCKKKLLKFSALSSALEVLFYHNLFAFFTLNFRIFCSIFASPILLKFRILLRNRLKYDFSRTFTVLASERNAKNVKFSANFFPVKNAKCLRHYFPLLLETLLDISPTAFKTNF